MYKIIIVVLLLIIAVMGGALLDSPPQVVVSDRLIDSMKRAKLAHQFYVLHPGMTTWYETSDAEWVEIYDEVIWVLKTIGG